MELFCALQSKLEVSLFGLPLQLLLKKAFNPRAQLLILVSPSLRLNPDYAMVCGGYKIRGRGSGLVGVLVIVLWLMPLLLLLLLLLLFLCTSGWQSWGQRSKDL